MWSVNVAQITRPLRPLVKTLRVLRSWVMHHVRQLACQSTKRILSMLSLESRPTRVLTLNTQPRSQRYDGGRYSFFGCLLPLTVSIPRNNSDRIRALPKSPRELIICVLKWKSIYHRCIIYYRRVDIQHTKTCIPHNEAPNPIGARVKWMTVPLLTDIIYKTAKFSRNSILTFVSSFGIALALCCVITRYQTVI